MQVLISSHFQTRYCEVVDPVEKNLHVPGDREVTRPTRSYIAY